MAVSNIVPIRRLPWGGGTGLGRPTGLWVGVATVIMDVSGGNAEAQLQFQAAADPLQALLYHVGQLYIIFSGNGSTRTVNLKTQEMGWGPGTGVGFSWQTNLGINMPASAAGFGEVAAQLNHIPKNILLGTPLASTDPAVLEAISDNVNGDTLTLAAMGYVWSQTALGEAGGPRIPEGSPWG